MKAVFAVDAMGGYAYKDGMPWAFGTYADDSNFYLNMTRGKNLLMGRNTWHAFENEQKGRLLKRSIVVTSIPEKATPFIRNVYEGNSFKIRKLITENPKTIDIDSVPRYATDDTVVIGGPSLIDHLMSEKLITELYVTRIPHIHRSDKFWEPTYDLFHYSSENFTETRSGIKIQKIRKIIRTGL